MSFVICGKAWVLAHNCRGTNNKERGVFGAPSSFALKAPLRRQKRKDKRSAVNPRKQLKANNEKVKRKFHLFFCVMGVMGIMGGLGEMKEQRAKMKD